jgi:MFS family permease
MICAAFYTYLLYSWYPKYLESARGMDNKESGWHSGGLLLAGTAGLFLGGYLTDALSARFGRRWACRSLGAGGMVLAAVCAAASIHLDNAIASSLVLAVALMGIAIEVCAWWAVMTDIAGTHVGALFGLCNSLGGIGSFSSQTFFGWFSDYRMRQDFRGRDAYDPAFYLYAGVLLVGAVCWLFIDPTTSAVEARDSSE